MCVRLLSPCNSCTLSHLLNGPSVCLVTNFLLGCFSATSRSISALRPIYSPLTFISEPGSFLDGVVDSDSLTTSWPCFFDIVWICIVFINSLSTGAFMSVSCSIRVMVRVAQDLIYPIAKLYLFDEYECT